MRIHYPVAAKPFYCDRLVFWIQTLLEVALNYQIYREMEPSHYNTIIYTKGVRPLGPEYEGPYPLKDIDDDECQENVLENLFLPLSFLIDLRVRIE